MSFKHVKYLTEKFSSLKFYDKNLDQVMTVNELLAETGGGLLPWINTDSDYHRETQIIEKMRMVRDVAQKFGDSAIDEYKRVTEQPDTSHPLYSDFRLVHDICPELEIDAMFIPISKGEFENYLKVYNAVIK